MKLSAMVVTALSTVLVFPAVAAPPGQEMQVSEQIICVPLRDNHDRPKAPNVCRTAAEWRAILSRHGSHADDDRPQPFNQLHDYGFRSAPRGRSSR
jgi:hypothetical protein